MKDFRSILAGTLLLSALFLFPCAANAQELLTETQKTESLIKIWGFLKYYHPSVAQGSMDWDQVFIAELDSLSGITTAARLSGHYQAWLSGLGDIKQYSAKTLDYEKPCNFNRSLEWIDNDTLFTPALTASLKEIIAHRCGADNRFVHASKAIGVAIFDHENDYPAMRYPDRGYRLLALARYWNMIEYFYPYKYLTDTPWNEVLTNFIPQLSEAHDTAAYVNALCKLVASVNDSHSILYPGVSFGAPCKTKVFRDKAIVTELLNDSLAKIDDIRTGDVILSVNDTSVKDWIKYMGPYIGASNEAVTRRNMAFIFYKVCKTRMARATIERNGAVISKNIHCYTVPEINFKGEPPADGPPCKTIAPGIGYINMGVLRPRDVKKALKRFADMKAIIFDQRNYPNLTFPKIGSYLLAYKTPFVKAAAPDFSFPGKFVCKGPFTIGRKKKGAYNGRVIVLVNEITQSQAEYTTMVLQARPHTTVIGSQTAGADGDAVYITLPGAHKIIMSGQGYYYPDGRQTQRTGIRPDIWIEPTIEGMRANKDEVLDRAILFANTGS